MSIQTRKLNVINYIINLADEIELQRIEAEILKSKKIGTSEYKPFTHDELLARVKESMEDYKEGNYSTQEDIEDESKNW